MTDREDDPRRRLPVEPPVHVETVVDHRSLTWTAGGLDRFLAAVRADDAVAADAPARVDARDVAGRGRRPLSAVAARPAITYVRVEATADWTVAWERRTEPTVSLSGAPSPATCRRLHVATTNCPGWIDADERLLERLVG